MNERYLSQSVASTLFEQVCHLPGALHSQRMQAVWFTEGTENGMIRLWEGHIVEMEIPQTGFWAHFDGNDAVLFYDHVHAFFEGLHNQQRGGSDMTFGMKPMKLLIICSAGLTSSIAASHINELAREHNWALQADWAAAGEPEIRTADADVILYAPQAAAAFRDLTEAEKQNRGLIPPLEFATMDTWAIVRQAQLLRA